MSDEAEAEGKMWFRRSGVIVLKAPVDVADAIRLQDLNAAFLPRFLSFLRNAVEKSKYAVGISDSTSVGKMDWELALCNM